MGKIVAVHQPNFFPWLGYFDKIARSDIFVFFDNVQFPKKGGSWSNRVKLLIAGDAKWVTASTERNYTGLRNINEMYFQDDNWRIKMLKSMDANYKKHSFYKETMDVIEPLILNSENNIVEYNIHAVKKFVQLLDLNSTELRRSSEFFLNHSSNQLLCSLVKKVGGNAYLCGDGSQGYLDECVFNESSIRLEYQRFKHPQYLQNKTQKFVSGLSIIDAVMNLGWDKIKRILRG
jgi:hypothetical protein